MLTLYRILFPLVFLFFLPGLVVKLIRRPGWKKTYWERFGIFSPSRRRELAEWKGAVWLHAVSVGEVNLALSLLREWVRLEPDRKFVLSTTTTTGQEIARAKAPGRTKVVFCPIDFGPCVRATMNLLAPSRLVVFETELWPNMLSIARKRGMRLALVNSRISDKSFRGYRRFRFFFAPVLRCFDLVCAQTRLDADRLTAIAPDVADRVSVCGNIKFDQPPPSGDGFDFRSLFGCDCTVLIAASTHDPEEVLIADAFSVLKREFPRLRLVLVPRHAERGADLEKMLKAKGLSYLRRSCGSSSGSPFDVLLADTTGELASLIKGSDLVVMGKTLAGNSEGQNIIEPAVMDKPIVCGRRLRNFRQALDILVKADAVRRVMDDSELVDALRSLLRDPEAARAMGRRAGDVMRASRGALERTLSALRGE